MEELQIKSKWKMAEVLPVKIEEQFLALIAEYIHMYYKEIQENIEVL